ncbi:MAG: leucine-rich repeat domain-containing protein [Spirochaetales bacterium]|jgi:hypothetical protein|nr:leucine-rich repeat domain-containing protein [Spirochaetales bacterium]
MKRRFTLVLIIIAFAISSAVAQDFEIDIDSAGHTVLVRYHGEGGDVYVTYGVTKIGDGAFAGISTIKSITLSGSVREIGDFAFVESSALEEVYIPEGVTSIGDMAFLACLSLQEIRVAPDNPRYASLQGALFDKQTRSLIAFPAGRSDRVYTIPQGIGAIGDAAFAGAGSLEEVIIPDSVTYIGFGAFAENTSLKKIVIPLSTVAIGDDAFWGCSALESITIPFSTTTIGKDILKGSASLREIRVEEGSVAYHHFMNSEYERYLVYHPSWLR